MNFYTESIVQSATYLGTKIESGLTEKDAKINEQKFGKNVLSKAKKKNLLGKIFDALKDPMILILIFGFCIAFGTKLGSFIKTGEKDFTECYGILTAIILCVSITLIMEGSSQKAFDTLNKLYDNISVNVIRNGKVTVISQQNVVVGDVVLLESGDKVIADGRLVESNDLSVDESALTGESYPSEKNCNLILRNGAPIAERKNCVYSGTFVKNGNGKMLVTSVGDKTEMGKIAGELSGKESDDSPLSQKLSKLGKIISIIGVAVSVLVFGLSILKLAVTNSLTFDSVQELFVSCIILIVAAVPEGLPTIVAISLALNMIKLAKENALIKKMHATETTGAVSIICSDKTGTLTLNKMTAIKFCTLKKDFSPDKIYDQVLLQNFVCNSTAEIVSQDNKTNYVGSGTECALIKCCINNLNASLKDYRKKYYVCDRIPFSSENKFMITQIKSDYFFRVLIKGASEKVLDKCILTELEKKKILFDMEEYQLNAQRIICFAHKDYQEKSNDLLGESGYVYDGFAVLTDPIRPEVFGAVKDCFSAGIEVKMLTGDNDVTAYSIAKKLGIAKDKSQVVNATELEKLDDDKLEKLLKNVTVVARSTPILKLRIVKILKRHGVVAVTGDGINDAPAIKRADVGIVMGKTGSEITKESADVILLDDSFATVVKAVAFGRNVYRNLQRFIIFQLSVNLSALIFVTVCAILGLEPPFNTLELLWINVIMDGPPALTLGLEKADRNILFDKPVKRDESIVSLKMLLRIIFNGTIIGGVLIVQFLTNFLNFPVIELKGAVFTLFILFQLFNAFNCRELDSTSIFKRIGKNKIMIYTFVAVFILHIIIVNVFSSLFGISPLSFISFVKCICLASTIVVISEIYKLIYRKMKSGLRVNFVKLKGIKKSKTKISVNKNQVESIN